MGFCPLPIGVDDFETIFRKNYYYVDKTLLIKELLDKKGQVNLIARPRRFGKTLNLSMLKYYFEDTGDEAQNKRNAGLFSGLAIARAGRSYADEMNRYPVIMLTLKSAKQMKYEDAAACLAEAIAGEYARHAQAVAGKLDSADLEKYMRIRRRQGGNADHLTSLAFLSECLYKAYGKKCIILLDEYDVPLENAYFAGFYEEMAAFVRSLFESALKTNVYLEFAVITGCLRISRESIFTGLNNLKSCTILSENYSRHFGFTEEEVLELLQYYGQMEQSERIKEWYDGYQFGSVEIYNPWSILNYIDELAANTEAFPRPYWANTSSNDIVRSLVERMDDGDGSVQVQLEQLMNGGTLEKQVHEDITYDNIYDSEDNLWNFLFFTGYLRKISSRMEGEGQYVTMAIPNMEVSYIYKNTIHAWFEKKQKEFDLSQLFAAMENGDAEKMGEEISYFLEKTISYFDYGESYYHGFLAGLLQRGGRYRVLSNREAGLGRADLILRTPRIRGGRAIILELKAVKSFREMETGCEAALDQIAEKQYRRELEEEGYEDILAYGLCFYRKECLAIRQIG